MRIMMVAGEASGDLHGSHLAREILKLNPAARIFGMGGRLMAEAGVDVLYDATRRSAVGFTEALKHIRPFMRVLNHFALLLEEEDPKVYVAIDFPTVNMKLVARARALGIPVVYYFSPAAWAWGERRARVLAELGVTICSVFPFEADFYRKAGAQVVYVGHPLVDLAQRKMDKAQARRALGLDPDRPVLGLLPGSRLQELRRHVKPMADAFRRLSETIPGLQAVIPVAPSVSAGTVKELLQGAPISLVEGRTHEVLSAADAAVVASGTATLEAAIIGTPQVVVYRLSGLSYRLARRMIRIPYASQPNIVAGREVVRELFQDDVNGRTIAESVAPFFTDPTAVQRIQADYAEIVRQLGRHGAAARAARIVLDAAAGQPIDPAKYERQEV